MAASTTNVVVGKPNPGFSVAPVGTALPTTAVVALNVAFKGLGYVSDDGLTESEDRNVDTITAWGGDTVATAQTSYEKTFQATLIEYLNSEVQALVRGSANITTTAATSTAGAKMTIITKSDPPPIKAVVIDVKSGSAIVRHVIPKAQVTEVGDTDWTGADPAGLDVTLTAFPDASGNYVYTYTDDGTFV